MEYIVLKYIRKSVIMVVVANPQNICNLVGREEYNIGHIVL